MSAPPSPLPDGHSCLIYEIGPLRIPVRSCPKMNSLTLHDLIAFVDPVYAREMELKGRCAYCGADLWEQVVKEQA